MLSRNTCIGTNCEVSRKAECKREEICKSGYHTHPSDSEPSMQDNKIKCYVKRKIPEKEESIVIEEAIKLIEKGYRLTVDESFMKMGFQDYIIKKYFETIKEEKTLQTT